MYNDIDPRDIQHPFDQSLGYNCHRLGVLVREQTARCLEEFGITPEQWQLLVFVAAAGEGITPGTLAGVTLRDKTTISRSLEVMLAPRGGPAGRPPLLERRAHPTDARSWTVHLTETSRTLLEQIRSRVEVFFPQQVFAALSPEEQSQLLALIQKLRRGLGDMAG